MILSEIKNMNAFEIIEYINTEDGKSLNDTEIEEVNSILNEKIESNMDEILLDKRLLEDKFEYILNIILEEEIPNPRVIAKLIHLGIDLDIILTNISFDFEIEEINELNAEDRKVFLEKIGKFLPINIQEELTKIGASLEELGIEEKSDNANIRSALVNNKKNTFKYLKIIGSMDNLNIQLDGMSIEEKVIVMKGLYRGDIVNLTKDMTDKDKIFVIDKLKNEKLYGSNIAKIIISMELENRLECIERYENKLDGLDLVNILDTFNQFTRIKLAKKYVNKLNDFNFLALKENMSENYKIMLLDICYSKLNSFMMTTYITDMSSKNKLIVLKKYGEKFTKEDICKMVKELQDSEIDELVEYLYINNKQAFNSILELSNIKYDSSKMGEEILKKLQDKFGEGKIIELFKTQKIGFKTAFQIKSEKEVSFIEKFGEIYDTDKSGINSIQLEKIKKIKSKNITDIAKKIGLNYGENKAIAFNMYCVLGMQKSLEILNGEYGKIDSKDIRKMVSNVNLSELTFDKNGNPEVNIEFINLIFGGKGTPKKDTPFATHLKEKDNDFFNSFSSIYNNWEKVFEEVARQKSVSKIQVKPNIDTVIKALKVIESGQFTPITRADFKLNNTEICDYAGKNTQYTFKPEKALARAYELSRHQEGCKVKKFPNVKVKNIETNMVVSTYYPQDRNILLGGYLSGCCFRPNGEADGRGNDKESLVNYCLTSEYAGVIKVETMDEKTGELKLVMFSPILRNGNMLMIHSMESNETSWAYMDLINKALVDYSKKVLEESREKEGANGIQAVLVTDLTRQGYPVGKNRLSLTKKFELHNDASSDTYTNLKETGHYVIARNKGVKEADLKFGDVEYSYEFPEQEEVLSGAYTKEDREFIKEYLTREKKLDLIKKESDKRYEMGKIKESDYCLKLLKKVRMDKHSQLKKSKFGIHMVDKYRKQIIYMQDVLERDEINNFKYLQAEENMFKRIMVGEDYFIALTEKGEIITHSKNPDKIDKNIEELKDFIGGDNVKVVSYKEYVENRIRNSDYIGGGSYER